MGYRFSLGIATHWPRRWWSVTPAVQGTGGPRPRDASDRRGDVIWTELDRRHPSVRPSVRLSPAGFAKNVSFVSPCSVRRKHLAGGGVDVPCSPPARRAVRPSTCALMEIDAGAGELVVGRSVDVMK